jgi:hypothetical protein
MEATAVAVPQPAHDDLERLGREIVALHAAGDKSQKKADDKYLAVGLKLIEARKQTASEVSFAAFLAEHCPTIGKSRAYELIRIAEGRTTQQQVSEENKKRKKRQRQRDRLAAERPRGPVSKTLLPQAAASVTSRTPSQANSPEWALAEFKMAVNTYLPKMDAAGKEAALAYLTEKMQPSPSLIADVATVASSARAAM